MRSETFTLHGQELEDGRIHITSSDLPGFRLLVASEKTMDSEITSALQLFYPLYIAAKAKAEATQRRPRLSSIRQVHGGMDLSAEFAFA